MALLVLVIGSGRGRIIARHSPHNPGQIATAQNILVTRIQVKMGTPEHRVRKAINQVLGYRNFANLVNNARVEAAKIRLSSAENADKTVLEIAYSVGFSSIGPFNRAFREVVGQSPSEFRGQ